MQSLPADNGAKLVWQWNGHWYSLPISKADVLMLGRAVEEEGFPQAGVAWALIQRAAWLRSKGVKITLGKLVEQYAQPLNPLWFPSGAKHQAEVARQLRLGNEQGAQDEIARAQRRPGKASKGWNEFSPETRKVVTEILSGQSKSPVTGAVHYWASRAPDFAGNQARKPELILLDRGYGFGPGRNVFFAEKGSERFGGVRVVNGDKAWPGGGGMQVAGMGGGSIFVGAIVGYLAWKWWLA